MEYQELKIPTFTASLKQCLAYKVKTGIYSFKNLIKYKYPSKYTSVKAVVLTDQPFWFTLNLSERKL